MADKEEPSKWEERPTCWVSKTPQGDPGWHNLRKGRITMSIISKLVNRSKYKEHPYSLTRKIVGLEPLPSDKLSEEKEREQNENFARGHRTEVILRKIYSAKLEKPINEVGLAVWKHDPRFGASLDGEIVTGGGIIEGVEFKAPKKMYQALIEHIEAIKKGFTPPPGDAAHIIKDHYDQMTGCGVIAGIKKMHYVVGVERSERCRDGALYTEALDVDYDHWKRVLYEPAVQIYETTIEPLMKENSVARIDPPQLKV